MKEWFKNNRYEILAAFFILLQVAIIVRNFYDSYINFFWFCDFTPIIIAIGLLMRNTAIVRGVVNVILIPQLVFLTGSILGTFVYPFFEFSYMIDAYGPMNYLVNGWFYLVVTMVTHFSSLLAMIFLLKKEDLESSLKYSAILIVLAFAATRIFTDAANNINYVFSFGGDFLAGLSWLLFIYFVLAVPTYKLQRLMKWVLGPGRKYFSFGSEEENSKA